ncbi:MAG: pyridoxamine kinase [Clostridiales bacterium]|nr:pyridoxamine kinase [Clostridiales bacterium]
MTPYIPAVAAIHDLSGFGRNSLSVVIPILSTMGAQAVALPTAVLSTHTGGFEGYAFMDLTAFMKEAIDHWVKLDLRFQCIYSGFLGSPVQGGLVSGLISQQRRNEPLVVVDPVMADNGKLYDTMDMDMVEGMRRLIGDADVITPNLTEASYLLGEAYRWDIGEDELKTWLTRLADMGPETVVITSAPLSRRGLDTSVVAYNRQSGHFWRVPCKYIPANYPGTGDVFTSVLTGSLLQGDSLPVALDRSVQFVTQAIRASYGFDYPRRNGVLLERVLNSLNGPVFTGSYEWLDLREDTAW